jgi:hypothetical protein
MKVLLLFILLSLNSIAVAEEKLTFLDYTKNEFQPDKGEVFSIPFYLPFKADIKINIFSPDGDLIREINYPITLKKGKQMLSWDGKDTKGVTVPDEAYYPVIYAKNEKGKVVIFDPHKSGGEVIDDLNIEITKEKNITFQLPYPARVLARIGIKSGPMLKDLSNWQPKNKGKVVLRWNGFDSDQLRDLRSNPNISFMVTAYRLPNFSIISSGNNTLSYQSYREKLGSKANIFKYKDKKLERNGHRVEHHYYIAKDVNLSPPLSLQFKEKYPQDKKGNPIIDCPCIVEVNLDDKGKAQLQESLYEIAFFIDDEFISEQEQGYVPFRWRWTPSALAEGEHILTVNVSGLRGEVSVKSLRFRVSK